MILVTIANVQYIVMGYIAPIIIESWIGLTGMFLSFSIVQFLTIIIYCVYFVESMGKT